MKKSNLIFFSGAGLSAPSGIPTFRDSEDGLWYNYDVNVVCDYNVWNKNFKIVHDFYNQRRSSIINVKPNEAHYMIAGWQGRYPYTKIQTQNVDKLLESAGCVDVVHLHGEIDQMKCLSCRNIWTIGNTNWDINTDVCPKCNGSTNVKPAVIFFNESAPNYVHYYEMLTNLREDDIIVVIGTSGEVLQISEDLRYKKCLKILNNREPCDFIDHTLFDHVFFESAESAASKISMVLESIIELR